MKNLQTVHMEADTEAKTQADESAGSLHLASALVVAVGVSGDCCDANV